MNNLNQTVVGLLVWALLLVMAAPILAETREEVGYIEGLHGPADAYSLLRGEKRINVALFTPVQAGDWICICGATHPPDEEGKRNSIVLNLGGERVELTAEQTPYLVKKTGEPPTLAGNLMRWAGGLFGEWRHHHHKTAAVHAGIRGETGPSIPLLELNYGDARLTVGKRTLHLAWQGGKPSYRVEVFREDTLLIVLTNIEGQRVRLENLQLTPGYYRVQVSDAEGATVTGQFQVVARERLPAMPAMVARELEQSTLPETAKATLFATWLAQQDEGAWEFEAYQRIAALAENYQPAALLRESLEEMSWKERSRFSFDLMSQEED